MKELDKLYKQIEKLNKQENTIRLKIRDLQNLCPHTNKKVRKNYNDHDGWSQVEITYYTDYHCDDCNKYWTEEQ